MRAPVRQEDCEVARTAEELIAWIKSVKDLFHTDDRIEKILIKAFFEEMKPLGHLARHKYLERPGFSLRPKIGDQNYDAEIIDASSGDENITRVEFTSTYRDDNFALRLEYLGRHGDVYWTGHVWRDGTKASGGQVHVVPDFEDHQILLDKMLDTIEARVANKLGKPYASNTILAIVFNDSILYHETDLPQLQPHFRDIMLSQQTLKKFCDVFIIGASGRTFWQFGETDPADMMR
jgi:hypothetical protein